MNYELSQEYADYVREKVASGAYATERDVLEDGLRYLRENDVLSQYTREELNAMIEEGERDFEEGNFVEFDRAELERIIEEAKQEFEDRQLQRTGVSNRAPA